MPADRPLPLLPVFSRPMPPAGLDVLDMAEMGAAALRERGDNHRQAALRATASAAGLAAIRQGESCLVELTDGEVVRGTFRYVETFVDGRRQIKHLVLNLPGDVPWSAPLRLVASIRRAPRVAISR